MKPVLVSFDAHNINDGTNFVGRIPYNTPMQAINTRALFVRRAGAFPIYAGKEFPESYIVLSITCKGTLRDQLETINQWFNVYDETPKQLIIKDTDDSDKQYYLYATPKNITNADGHNVKIVLARKDPIWQSVTQNDTNWAITASGATQDITNAGNIEAYPILEFTPTTYPSGGGGWPYDRSVSMYPNSSYTFVNRPLEIMGALDTTALVNDTTVSNQINIVGGIDAVVTTIPIDTSVGGGLPTVGMGYCGTEQISWTGNSAGNLTGVTRGIGGTTAAVHADNAVIARSKMMANGNDVRVLVDGVEVNRWFGTGSAAMNQTGTKCWIVLTIPAKAQTTLLTSISNVGTPTTIDITFTTDNLAAANRMPYSGRVLIDSEEFTYTAKSITQTYITLTVDTRATRNTSAASHSVGAAIRWVPYDIKIVYGNEVAAAPDISNTTKPVIALTSTNASFVYADFYDITTPRGQRAGIWKPYIVKLTNPTNSKSKVYFGTNLGADTDPAEVMGAQIIGYKLGSKAKAETSEIEWRLEIPDGVSSVDSNGSKYRVDTTWATDARLYSSADGSNWVPEWAATEPTPVAAITWTAWSYAGEAVPSTSRFLKFRFVGTTKAVLTSYMAMEVTAATLTLVNYPTVALRTEQQSYYITARITNTTTGKYIVIQYTMQINQTLYIDCDPNQPTAKKFGQLVDVVKPDTNRSNWFPFQPGVNHLAFTTASNSNITCHVKWRDRMNFL